MVSKYVFTEANIIDSLRESGLKEGDNPFVSSGFGMIGVLVDQQNNPINDINDVCAVFLRAIRSVIGLGGTVFAPTYSYTIGRSSQKNVAVFDRFETPSEVGPFGEFLRLQPGAKRNRDPMVSVAGQGPAINILDECAQTSYGKDGVFERLLWLGDSKVTNIGLGPNWMPFIHYADSISDVPFRYDKLFLGWELDYGLEKPMIWHYQVPARIPQARANGHRIGAICVDKGVFRSSKLGRARIFTADYGEFFERCIEGLFHDRWLTADGPACDVLAEDIARLPDLPDDVSQPSAAISLAQSDRIDEISARCPELSLVTRPTGANVFDWVVPERYVLRSAELSDSAGSSVNGPRLLPYSVSTTDVVVTGAELLEREARFMTNNTPTWILRDWAFTDVSELDVDARYRVKIDSDTSIGLFKALVCVASEAPETLIYFDTCCSSKFASLDVAEAVGELFWNCNGYHKAAACGDVGLAIAIEKIGVSNVKNVVHIRLVEDGFDSSERVEGLELKSGNNPVAQETVPCVSVARVSLTILDIQEFFNLDVSQLFGDVNQ